MQEIIFQVCVTDSLISYINIQFLNLFLLQKLNFPYDLKQNRTMFLKLILKGFFSQQYDERAVVTLKDQTVRYILREKMAVALTTCCLFDSAARISFSHVIPMFIDDGSPCPQSIVGVLKHFTSSNTSSVENKE